MLGKLSWDAIPFHEPIALVAGGGAVLGVLAVLALITVKGWWPSLDFQCRTVSTLRKQSALFSI